MYNEDIHHTLYIIHYTLYIVHYTLYIVHYTLYIIHCTLYIVHYTLYIIHYTLYIVHYTSYIVHYTLYIIHCTSYIIHYTLYIIHCTMYNVQCTLYNVKWVNNFFIDIPKMPGHLKNISRGSENWCSYRADLKDSMLTFNQVSPKIFLNDQAIPGCLENSYWGILTVYMKCIWSYSFI